MRCAGCRLDDPSVCCTLANAVLLESSDVEVWVMHTDHPAAAGAVRRCRAAAEGAAVYSMRHHQGGGGGQDAAGRQARCGGGTVGGPPPGLRAGALRQAQCPTQASRLTAHLLLVCARVSAYQVSGLLCATIWALPQLACWHQLC